MVENKEFPVDEGVLYFQFDEDITQEEIRELYRVMDEHWKPEGVGYFFPGMSWDEFVSEEEKEFLEDELNPLYEPRD